MEVGLKAQNATQIFPRLSFEHAFPFAYVHKFFSGSKLEGSKCNPNFPRLNFEHAFPSTYGHKLFNGNRLEGSKCNPNFQG